MLSAFCANAVPEKRKRQLQKIAKEAKVRENQIPFVNFVSFCSRFSKFWVIFINLTCSFSALLSGLCRSASTLQLFNVVKARGAHGALRAQRRRSRLALRSLVLDPFYGVQGKFLKIFGMNHEWTRIDTNKRRSRQPRMTRISPGAREARTRESFRSWSVKAPWEPRSFTDAAHGAAFGKLNHELAAEKRKRQ